MKRAPGRLIVALLVSVGCISSQSPSQQPVGPICGTCDGNTEAARRAWQIELVETRDKVAGCQMIGTVMGWEDLVKRNNAYWLAKARGLYAGRATPLIRVLLIHGGDDEAYNCGLSK